MAIIVNYAFEEIHVQVNNGHATKIIVLPLSTFITKEKAQKKLAKLSREEENDDEETSSDDEDDMLVIHDEDDDDDTDDDELVKGSFMHVEVKVVEAYDLPPALCNYVFCQYKFWNDDNTIVVPPINASISNPGPKTNTMIFEHKQVSMIPTQGGGSYGWGGCSDLLRGVKILFCGLCLKWFHP